MGTYFRHSLSLLTAIGVVAASTTLASAQLEESSLIPGDNDGLVTLDTASSLEWLDLSFTDGWSVNQAKASPFVTSGAFRVATAEELVGLLESAGIPAGRLDPAGAGQQGIEYSESCEIGCDTAGENELSTAYSALSRLLGTTYFLDTPVVFPSRLGSTSSAINGLFLSPIGADGIGSLRSSFHNSIDLIPPLPSRDTSYSMTLFSDQTNANRDTTDPNFGVFLVRVPGSNTCAVPASHRGRFNNFGLNSVDDDQSAGLVGALGALGGPAPGIESRGFLSFDVSELDAVVSDAVLRLGIESYTSQHQDLDVENLTCSLIEHPSENYFVTAVSTPVSDLIVDYAPDGGPGLPANSAGQTIFGDLGKGFSESAYSSFTVIPSDAGGFIEIPLSAQAVTAINAAISNSEQFTLGLDYSGNARGAVLFCPAENINIEILDPASAHELILTKTYLPEPFCDLDLNQESYAPGDTVTLSKIEIGAQGEGPLEVDIKIWQRDPSGIKTKLLSLCDAAVLGGTSQDWGPAWILTVDENTQLGEYQVGCRILCPIDGSILGEEIVSFTVNEE